MKRRIFNRILDLAPPGEQKFSVDKLVKDVGLDIDA